MPDEPQPIRTEEKQVGGYTRQVAVFQKQCVVCGATFEGVARAKFCSRSCASRDWDRRHPENLRGRQKRYQQRKKGQQR